ncbi:hypothetical protein RB595_003018 [Gaeumannomyces hyphopodioides]
MAHAASTPTPSTRLLLALLLLLLHLPPLPTPHAAAHPQAPTARARPYLDAVCKPPTLRAGEVVPPCISADVTEALCFPNGTTPLHVEAHAQCMCRGSYFAERSACRACLALHGLLPPEPDAALHAAVDAAASSALCGFLAADPPPATPSPPPPVPFRALSGSAEAALLPGRAGGAATAMAPGAGHEGPGPGDKAPSRTEVSLYYTPSGPQGPGPITGSAALASATGLQFATGKPPLLGTAGSPPPPLLTASPPLTPFGTGAPGSSGAGTTTGHSPSVSRVAAGLRPGKRRVLVSLGFWALATRSVL